MLSDNIRIVQETVKKLGGLDIIIANAGWTKPSQFEDLDALNTDEWNKVRVKVISMLSILTSKVLGN